MKIFLLPIIGLASFILSIYNPITFNATKPITICNSIAIANLPVATNFLPNNMVATLVRKNIYNFTPAEITTLKTGIAAMKLLPKTDPTSWTYQAAIHGTTLADNLASWNSCQHGTQFFLSWHRMYLYYFERILRSKSGNPNFALPYWNYQINAAIHPDYRNSAASNTLYDATRNASMNSGGSLSAGIMTNINTALTKIPFATFNTSLEGPHGAVHGAIGGNMGAVNKAAKDPVFWLHHTNIDRLWEEWLRKCGGRVNPTTGPWTTQVFTFFDETGAAKNMTGAQIVSTASQLGYRYDFPPKLPCNFVLVDLSKWRWTVIPPFRIVDKLRLNLEKSDAVFNRIDENLWEKNVRDNKIEKFNFSNTDISDQVWIEMDHLQIDKNPEGTIEVYLNLPKNEVPSERSKSFVGVLDLFTASAHRGHNTGNKNRIDATEAIKNLGLDMTKLKKSKITFYQRGNNVKGRAIKTAGDVNIEGLSFVVHKARKS
ncbi:MAG: tyrosinase family protein [Bacteroidota bacterium]